MVGEKKAVTRDQDHRYWHATGKELLSVTRILREGHLVDEEAAKHYTPESAQRGTDVHDALAMYFEGTQPILSEIVAPYWPSIMTFLRDGGFEVESAERIVYDSLLNYAGQYDMVGWLAKFGKSEYERDLIDVKTGSVPRTVGPQTMAYRRALPPYWNVRRWALKVTPERCRLFPLNMLASGRVDRQIDKRDEADFLAALRIANFRREPVMIG